MVRPWIACLLAVVGSVQTLSPEGAVTRGRLGRRQLALVFTGHEYAEGGDVILDALARRNVKASFFLTGDFLRTPAFRPLVKRLVHDGHDIGPHSDKHLLYCDWTGRKTLVSRAEFRADLEANVREIERIGGAGDRVRYFLPAYEWCNREIVGWARDMGFETVNFTPGTRSNADYTEDAAANHVSSAVIVKSILDAEAADPHGLDGFLLLLHLGAGPRRTDKLHARFAELLDAIAARGYRFVRLDDLLR